MQDVSYHNLKYKNIDEVGVYAGKGDNVTLIFFGGKRASDTLVEPFESHMVQYTPCKAYREVPLADLLSFLVEHPASSDAPKKYRGRSEA